MKHDLVQRILNKEDPFDSNITENPDDARSLYYSCLIYEQVISHLSSEEKRTFWENELEKGEEFKDFSLRMSKYDEEINYPNSILVENNTICNAHCTNCTHEELIKNGMRPSVNVSEDDLKYRIKKAKLLKCLINPDGKCHIDLTGFGEPSLNPNILPAIRYANSIFGNAYLTSNGSMLTDEWLEIFFKTGASELQLSLSYFDKSTYEQQIGLPYEKTKENMLNAFKIRNRLGSDTIIAVHIFDNELNSQEDKKAFLDCFSGLKKEKDNVYFRQYDELADNGIKTRSELVAAKPCHTLWQGLVIDVNGNVKPCCHGIWIPHEEDISFGRITDDLEKIMQKMLAMREEHIRGQYCKTCRSCYYLYVKQHPLNLVNVDVPLEIKDLRKQYSKLYLYGCGEVGAELYAMLRRNGIDIEGFIDSYKRKDTYYRKAVLGPDDLFCDPETGIIISTGNEGAKKEIQSLLKEKGFADNQIFVQNMYK